MVPCRKRVAGVRSSSFCSAVIISKIERNAGNMGGPRGFSYSLDPTVSQNVGVKMLQSDPALAGAPGVAGLATASGRLHNTHFTRVFSSQLSTTFPWAAKRTLNRPYTSLSIGDSLAPMVNWDGVGYTPPLGKGDGVSYSFSTPLPPAGTRVDRSTSRVAQNFPRQT